jgi:hypothetical protein
MKREQFKIAYDGRPRGLGFIVVAGLPLRLELGDRLPEEPTFRGAVSRDVSFRQG